MRNSRPRQLQKKKLKPSDSVKLSRVEASKTCQLIAETKFCTPQESRTTYGSPKARFQLIWPLALALAAKLLVLPSDKVSEDRGIGGGKGGRRRRPRGIGRKKNRTKGRGGEGLLRHTRLVPQTGHRELMGIELQIRTLLCRGAKVGGSCEGWQHGIDAKSWKMRIWLRWECPMFCRRTHLVPQTLGSDSGCLIS